jgi:hypothetical protein
MLLIFIKSLGVERKWTKDRGFPSEAQREIVYTGITENFKMYV